MTKLVSIIVSVYKAVLEKCIESLIDLRWTRIILKRYL